MIRVPLPPFQGVQATGTAVIPAIPQGMTYECIVLELGGTAFTLADITAIRVKLGGKVIWNITATDLQSINSYYDITADVARVPLWFADPNARSADEYMLCALDTSVGYSSFSIECDIAGATAPTLVAYALQSAPISRTKPYVGMFRTLEQQVIAPTATGILQSQAISTGTDVGALIKAVHLFSANATQLDVSKDGFYLQQNGYRATIQSEEAERGRVIQAGLFSFDPLAGKHYVSECVSNLNAAGKPSNLLWNLSISAAETIRAYADLVRSFGAV